MDIEGKTGEQSTYNEAIAQLKRLDRLYVLAQEYSRKGYDTQWRDVLDCIWRELCIDALRIGGVADEWDQEIIVKKNKFYAIMKRIDEDVAAAFLSKERGKLRGILNEKEMFLRFLQDKSGKGGKYEDPEDERDMLG